MRDLPVYMTIHYFAGFFKTLKIFKSTFLDNLMSEVENVKTENVRLRQIIYGTLWTWLRGDLGRVSAPNYHPCQYHTINISWKACHFLINQYKVLPRKYIISSLKNHYVPRWRPRVWLMANMVESERSDDVKLNGEKDLVWMVCETRRRAKVNGVWK